MAPLHLNPSGPIRHDARLGCARWLPMDAVAHEKSSGIANVFVTAVPALLFGVRLTAAVSLALFTAFYLELDAPYWAGTSAAIVCQPVVGSSLLKGVYRLVGTLVGTIAALALTAVFPQERAGFLFAMLLWAAACSFVSTLLKNFAAYGAMLAGYTLIIIASSVIPQPDQIFQIAMNRASEISIGIASGTLVIALTSLGDSPQRLEMLLSELIEETARHFEGILAEPWSAAGPEKRRMLIKRTADLIPVIDQAAGESPEIMQRRAILRVAVDGLFAAISGARIVETHLRGLPSDEANHIAAEIADVLPPEWSPGAALYRDFDAALVRKFMAIKTNDVSWRLAADASAEVATGLEAAANGLALLRDPRTARDAVRMPNVIVADYLPALVNAIRVFIGVGIAVLFWIVTQWPAGLYAVMFSGITIMLLSPLLDLSSKAALGQVVGTLIAAVVAGLLKFTVLINHETFLALSLILSLALVPIGALSVVPLFAPVFIPATVNFMPLFAPTNVMTFDPQNYLNTALGLVAGCVAGGIALVLIPHPSPAHRAQRLVDLSIRDLRRLAAGRRRWTFTQWQGRIYSRLAALPEEADPVQRSRLVSTLPVGVQLIRLRPLSKHGRIGAEIRDFSDALAAGDLPRVRHILKVLDKEIASIPESEPGVRGRMRARAMLLAVAEAVARSTDFFGSQPT
ncbi:FUSC family protein [Hyphomicrobium sp.]|uniref:FUSC family protein n=1 Tax=Hyphomicrobium sp. TaxID=82 RepID=UPI002D7679EB|nr:FUSC family protein [Hyphomicrobium sp.]HET6390189.1 FUSC family protein [Hyphomicrobium sp.]